MQHGIAKARLGDGYHVFASGNGVKTEGAGVVGCGNRIPARVFGVEKNLRPLDWTVLRVVDDALHRAENGGVG